jgi:phosphoserine aminotransferase
MIRSYPISFNAGPTFIPDNVIQAIHDVADSGFLSTSHRSKEFSEVSRKAIEGLRKQMRIPDNYHIFYQNSSTVAWDTVIQNIVKENSFHFVCGEFSNRWHQTAEKLIPHAKKYETPSGEAVLWENAKVPRETELIAITHNETRSGLQWPFETIRDIRNSYPDKTLAIDVCSSFGGMAMDWTLADVWLGSVQKCLTLPPGLAYLLVSDRAFERAVQLNKPIPAWHRFSIMQEQMKVYQTFETPNMLAIGLLARLMENWDIDAIEQKTREKAKILYQAPLPWSPYVSDKKWQSIVTTMFKVQNASEWRDKALKGGFALGGTFGQDAENSVRICNFPGHTPQMFHDLIKALS